MGCENSKPEVNEPLSPNQRTSILIVGATGILGSLITRACLQKPNLLVNILVRDPTKTKDLVAEVEKAGGRVIQGDLTNPSSLTDVTKGIHTVVSTINNFDEKTFVGGHKALIDDSVKNGVTRFVPSNFGVSYDRFTQEELYRCAFIGYKKDIDAHLAKTKLKVLSFSNGFFIETFFYTQQQGFGYWGEQNHVMDLTTYDDTARFVASAVADKNKTGNLTVVGNELTYDQVIGVYNKVRGTHYTPTRFGSLGDLKAAWEQKIKEQDHMNATWLALFLLIWDDRSKAVTINNRDYPSVKLTSLEEFLKKNPETKFP